MENYDIGTIYEIFGYDYKIKITPIHINKYKNISTHINLLNCENILRTVNGLSSSSRLTIYQIEIDNPNDQMLINNIFYEVYDENKTKLNLSVCQNETIEINYEINTTMINMTKVEYYSEQGINVFDIKDDFFNDICYPYSEDDSDMILKDRVNDIYENYSICENNCEFDSINIQLNKSTCKCDVKTTIESGIENAILDQILIDSLEYSNLAVIICYKLVFNFKSKINNIGFWIFTILVLAHIPFIIYYLIFNISSIKKYIFVQMNKFGYFPHKVNPIKKANNKNKMKNEFNIESIIKHDKGKQFNKSREKKNKMKNLIKSKGSNYSSFAKCLDLKYAFNSNNTLNEIKNHSNKYLDKKKKSISIIKQNIMSKKDFKIINNTFINIYNKNQNNNKITKQKKYKPSPKSYSLIQIDANNTLSKIPVESYILLDNYDYESSIEYDKRSFWRIFYICLLAKENFINIIIFRTPLDLQGLRICLFIFTNGCDLAFNTLFYSNENISEKYHYQGDNVLYFTLFNNIIKSLLSSIISIIIINLFQHMIECRGDFENVFRKEEIKLRKNKKYKVNNQTKKNMLKNILKIFKKIKIKIIIFFILELLMMLFFYYFVTAFCEVYKNTQISWINDFFVSLLISIATEIFLSWILSILYIISIRYQVKFIYKIVLFFYNL